MLTKYLQPRKLFCVRHCYRMGRNDRMGYSSRQRADLSACSLFELSNTFSDRIANVITNCEPNAVCADHCNHLV